MHVMTDEGVEGICDVPSYPAPMPEGSLEQLRRLVVGEDALHRELLYQKLHTGTRWVYFHPGWAGTFDNCLWDIVGKAAGLPVHAIIGRVRDSAPVYMNIGGPTKELAAEDAVSRGRRRLSRRQRPLLPPGGREHPVAPDRPGGGRARH